LNQQRPYKRTEDRKNGRKSPEKGGQEPRREGQEPRREGVKSRPGGRKHPEKGGQEQRREGQEQRREGLKSRPGGRVQAGKEGRTFRKKDPEKEQTMRLNRYIASSGICSRRDADDLISAGVITVNGKVVKELGTKVNPGDVVRYNGERIKNERKVYVLLNKPRDYVTTMDDPKERKTVMQLVRNACSERIYPVGRLDRNSSGLLLFTNDGELAKKLTHPGYQKKKIYHVFLDKAVTEADMNKLAAGLTLEDGFIQPDAISYANNDDPSEVGLEIHSGRNRIVRRMFESLGYRVNKLDRVYFAGLTKKNLPRGKWRFLTPGEIRMLKMDSYK